MLSPRGTLVVPQKYLPFLGAGAAAAATLAYILWGPDSDARARTGRSSKQRKVAGLENLGNTCYLNTILQSLAACSAFVKWLSRALRQGFFRGKLNELAYKLSKTLEVVNDHSVGAGDSQVYSPHEVLHALYGCSWRADRGQQDAHELFQFLLSVLGEEKEPEPSPVTLCDAPRLMEPGKSGLMGPSHPDLHSNIEASLPKVASRDSGSPFRGLLANHLSCTVCGHRNPVTYSSFDCLTLPIPETVFGALSLESVLASYTQRELVHDVDCSECAKVLRGAAAGAPPDRRAVDSPPPSVKRPVPPTPKRARPRHLAAPNPAPAKLAPPVSAVAAPSPSSPSLAPPTSGIPSPDASAGVHPLPVAAPPVNGLAAPASHHNSQRTPPAEESPDGHARPAEGRADGGAASPTCPTGDASVSAVSPREHRPREQADLRPETCNGAEDRYELERPQGPRETSLRTGDPDEASAAECGKAERREERPRANGHCADSFGDAEPPLSAPLAGENGVGRPMTPTTSSEVGLTDRDPTPAESRLKLDTDSLQTPGPLISSSSSRSRSGHALVPPCPSAADPSLPDQTASPEPSPPPLQRQPPPRSDNRAETPPARSAFGRIPGAVGTARPPAEAPGRTDGGSSPDDDDAPLPKCRRIFRKQLTLGKLPQCLCIHLQRVTWVGAGLPSRREEHVIFPEYLDLSPYRQTASQGAAPHPASARLSRLASDLSDDGATPWDVPTTRRKNSSGFIGGNFLLDSVGMSLVGGGLGHRSPRGVRSSPAWLSVERQEKGGAAARGAVPSGEGVGRRPRSCRTTESRYRLASAVVHQGDAFSGHFLTFRRAPSTGGEPTSESWLCASDESVYGSTAREVFSQKAYMLYYQRC